MNSINLTNHQARQFILLKQGLLGDYKFKGKDGVLQFVKQAGCVQFDPIDVCGKNAELVLQSRVEGFTKTMLNQLLYEDRVLLDYFDKNLAIVHVHDWKYFERTRAHYRQKGRGREEVDAVAVEIMATIAEKGAVSSKDLDMHEKVDWYWSATKISRAALETLYFRGDLIVHHKKGTIKYYGLAAEHLPEDVLLAPNPLVEDIDYHKWQVCRRISAVGLLWNKASDAWLCIDGMKTAERSSVFKSLLEERQIIKVEVEGCKEPLYALSTDLDLLKRIKSGDAYKPRMEFIAALDSFLWDRKLIKTLFNFDYKWEIYTPALQRKYGYYVLPLLFGAELIGRVEVVCERKKSQLVLNDIWFESEVQVTKEISLYLTDCLERFRVFHGLNELSIGQSCGSIDELLLKKGNRF